MCVKSLLLSLTPFLWYDTHTHIDADRQADKCLTSVLPELKKQTHEQEISPVDFSAQGLHQDRLLYSPDEGLEQKRWLNDSLVHVFSSSAPVIPMLNMCCYLSHRDPHGRFVLFHFAIFIRIKTDRQTDRHTHRHTDTDTLCLVLFQFDCWLLIFTVQPWDTLILKDLTCLHTGPKTGGHCCVLALEVFISIFQCWHEYDQLMKGPFQL